MSTKGLVELAQVLDAGAAGGGEIAIFGGIDALAVFEAADQFGNQEIEIHVALTVGVADHIDRHAHHVGGKIAAVVEIETAQKILVGLAVAGVLGDDHAGNGFEYFGWAQQRAVGELLGGHRAFGGRIGDAGQVMGAAADGDFLQGGEAGGVQVAGKCQHHGGSKQRCFAGVVLGETG
jgi:hypothetical protein